MTNVNVTVSKVKFAGKTPMCLNGKCRKFYSLKKMDEVQLGVAHETGLCPLCQADDAIVAEFKPVATKSEIVKQVAAEKGLEVVDIPMTKVEIEDGTITAVPKAASVKPSKQIKAIITSLVENNMINESMLASLCDKQYSLKELGGVKYPFMKEVDPTQDIRQQVMIAGKARYSTKVMSICGKSVVMTNDLYEKNLKAIQKWAEGFDMAKVV